VIEPMMNDPLVEFVGEISDAEKPDFLGHAAALLFPIDWPEPFGLVMIEAMACGTPVIAWGNGSVFEVVDEGQTGFIVHDLEAAATAVGMAASLSRNRVREIFERRFSARVMALDYVDLFRRKILQAKPIRVVA
jgi:glycosyltransferase involved in cell wall biosynthesis